MWNIWEKAKTKADQPIHTHKKRFEEFNSFSHENALSKYKVKVEQYSVNIHINNMIDGCTIVIQSVLLTAYR